MQLKSFWRKRAVTEEIARFISNWHAILRRLSICSTSALGRLEGEGLTAKTLAIWCDDHFKDNIAYALKGHSVW